jgi:hypothetical protein
MEIKDIVQSTSLAARGFDTIEHVHGAVIGWSGYKIP